MSSNRERSMLMKLIISADDLKLLEAYANNRKEYTKVIQHSLLFDVINFSCYNL